MRSKFTFRFLLRTAIFVGFACLGGLRGSGFAITLANLLALGAVFCAAFATLSREAVFGRDLTNWDEAVAFLFMSCGLRFFI